MRVVTVMDKDVRISGLHAEPDSPTYLREVARLDASLKKGISHLVSMEMRYYEGNDASQLTWPMVRKRACLAEGSIVVRVC